MARHIAVKAGSGNFWVKVGLVGTFLGLGALIWKAASPGRKCPTCDRILEAVNALQMICPQCRVVTFKA